MVHGARIRVGQGWDIHTRDPARFGVLDVEHMVAGPGFIQCHTP